MNTLPITSLAAHKVFDLLTSGNALEQQVKSLAGEANVSVPSIPSAQVVISSISPEIGDKNVQLSYPRVCLYSSGLKNTQLEKFRSLSGTVAVVAEIWASGDMVTQSDEWIHFYVEGVTELLRQRIGDWGDGMFFAGVYEVQFQAAKAGGLGFVQSAKVTCSVNVSRN